MSKIIKGSLSSQVEAYVLSAGEVTIDQVFEKLKHLVIASRAAAFAQGRKRRHLRQVISRGQKVPFLTATQLVARGRRAVIGNSLKWLANRGRLTHVARGVYGPPKPKIFDPPAESKTA